MEKRIFLLTMFCLFLFSCKEDKAIEVTASDMSTNGKENEEKEIKQSNYISNPSLWLGPTLWEKGFAVELEMSSLGTHREHVTTLKSIEKYKVGESTSKIPQIRADEWGYTVLNLRTGQQDGSGRKINNIYLDNLSDISNREEALKKIMDFVKQQYGFQTGSDTWSTISQGYPWYSMNGHHCWHHYAGQEGATVIGSEIGENIHGYQLHIAMNRGAAKQYKRPWVIDFSSWHGAGILDYSKNPIWPKYSGPNHGHSISLVERSMLMSYMAGADAVVAEAGGSIAFYDEKTSDGTYGLTPYGEVFQRLTAFAQQYRTGITYTPSAILLNRYHGMDRRPDGQKAFGKFPYEEGDKASFNLIEKLWPGTFSVEKNGNEKGTLVNSSFGDQFDFLLQNAPLQLLQTYKTVMLSGNIVFSDSELSNIKKYIESGGTLLVDSDNSGRMGLNAEGSGNVRTKKMGKGLIVEYRMSELDFILKKYFKYDAPFRLSEPVQYFVNVKNGAFYVTLINNDGIAKTHFHQPVIDNSKSKKLTVTYTGKAKLKTIKEIWKNRQISIEDNAATVILYPGEAAVLEFTQQ